MTTVLTKESADVLSDSVREAMAAVYYATTGKSLPAVMIYIYDPMNRNDDPICSKTLYSKTIEENVALRKRITKAAWEVVEGLIPSSNSGDTTSKKSRYGEAKLSTHGRALSVRLGSFITYRVTLAFVSVDYELKPEFVNMVSGAGFNRAEGLLFEAYKKNKGTTSHFLGFASYFNPSAATESIH